MIISRTRLPRWIALALGGLGMAIAPMGFRDRATRSGEAHNTHPPLSLAPAQAAGSLRTFVERDPFSPNWSPADHGEAARPDVDQELPLSLPEGPAWTLRGIVVGEPAVAVIDGSTRGPWAVVGIGDEVDGWTVRSIGRSSLDVSRGSLEVRIDLLQVAGDSS